MIGACVDSTVVTLTLLPVLASAAIARADTPVASPTVPSSALPPDQAPTFDQRFMPPSMTEQVLMPPGMTPPVDCDDPELETRPECQPSYGYYYTESGGVIRGGFGHYFWVSGG